MAGLTGLAAVQNFPFSRDFGYIQEDSVQRPVDSRVHIGHVHLMVADLERALVFTMFTYPLDLAAWLTEAAKTT